MKINGLDALKTDEEFCQIKDPFGNVIGMQGKYRK